MSRAIRSPVVVSALVALLLFAVTLGGVFIYDDVGVVVSDPRLGPPVDWHGLWTDSYNRGVDNLYRPLVSTTYAVQRLLHGRAPMPYHAVNWLLHALVTAQVAWIAGRLARRSAHPSPGGVAWIAGLLFATHPLHVEAVAQVVGRAELMCAAGTLGAVSLCLAPLTAWRVTGAIACFVVALLSKEQGLLAPLVVGACALLTSTRFARPTPLRDPQRDPTDRHPWASGNASEADVRTSRAPDDRDARAVASEANDDASLSGLAPRLEGASRAETPTDRHPWASGNASEADVRTSRAPDDRDARAVASDVGADASRVERGPHVADASRIESAPRVEPASGAETPTDRPPRDADRAGERGAGAARQRQLASILFVAFMGGIAGTVVLREEVIGLKLWWDRWFLDPWIQPLVDVGPWDRATGALAIAGRYLQLLVAPVTLRIDYGGPIVPGVTRPGDPYLWAGIGAVLLWLGLAAYAVVRRERLLIASLLSFAFLYGMVGNVVTLIGVNVAERLMYLPSAFFVIVVATLAARLPRRAWAIGLAVVASAYAARSFDYARRWNDQAAFYEYALRAEPRSLKAALLATQARYDRGQLDAAERSARHAIALDPTYDDPWCRLALVYMERGDFAEAERLLNHAADLNPGGRSATFFQELADRRAATQPTTRQVSR